MARLEGETSNAPTNDSKAIDTNSLFEVLEQWERQLTHSDLNQKTNPKSQGPKL